MTLVSWRPARELMTVQDEMNRIFDRFFGPSRYDENEPAAWHPRMDIKENRDEFIVVTELPGLKKEDIHVVYRDGMLTVEGERKQEKEEKDVNYHRVERSFGKFCRSFQLPTTVKQDKISASFKDGILELHLPKAEEVKPKEIEVKVS